MSVVLEKNGNYVLKVYSHLNKAVNDKNDKRLIKKNVRIIGNIHTDKGVRL